MENSADTIFFNQLCETYYTRIYRYCMVRLHDAAGAEDLTQEVFVVAWTRRKDLMVHENPPGFLYVTAQNLTLARLRKQKKEPLPLSEDYDAPSLDGDAFAQWYREVDEKIDEGEYLAPILAALSPESLALYRDYYIAHRPLKEIAREQGVSEVALRMRLVRLRRRVKKLIAGKNWDIL